jgi:hypothetical protein
MALLTLSRVILVYVPRLPHHEKRGRKDKREASEGRLDLLSYPVTIPREDIARIWCGTLGKFSHRIQFMEDASGSILIYGFLKRTMT